eukprot:g11962.t1
MSSSGHVERVFLGCDRPALHTATDWLIRQFGSSDAGLGELLIAVPGGRAMRRLEERLAQRSAGKAIVPPRVVTVGGLGDRLLPADSALVLREVYGDQTLQRYAEADRPLVVALEQVMATLQSLVKIEPSLAPHCSFAQAVTLVISQVAGQAIPDPGGKPAIELVGYLELLLDDAPRLVIAGMNEQHVPEPPRVSPLLPEGVRRSVGLADDAHRLARDGYALSTMLASRDGMRLIVGKRSADGDPLLPSRLLLKTDDETMVRRVRDFTAEPEEPASSTPTLLTPGKHDRFVMPMPLLPDEPITSLPVTAFRDYLACPYRFYLKHVLRLDTLDDNAVEVSARGFGTLAHEALRVLAGEDMRAVTDERLIADRLSSALDTAFKRRFGSEPPVAARVQREQLRYRLQAFAPKHAETVKAGWRIEHEEKTRTAKVMVDGQPFTIRGQIDRIDKHPEHGWRLIDYKTADTAKGPAKTHRKKVDGVEQWADLQLPLYLDLAADLGVDRSAQLGYINLPKKVSDAQYGLFDLAGWDADLLEQARERRDVVIRQVRAGVFWPPSEPPVFDDGLRQLCGDEVVRASAGAGKTYQLTTRYLDLLVRQEAPEHILATTFTRKAAGEVLARVLGRLAQACSDDKARQALAQALRQPDLTQADCLMMLRSLTDRLNRLAVGTIDGFFNRAARALSLDLDLPPDPRLIDEGSPLAQQMRFDAIQAALGEQADQDDGMATLIEMLRRLHHDTAQRSVTEAIDAIVKDLGDVYRNNPDATLWDQLPVTGLLKQELLDSAINGLEAMNDALPVKSDGDPYAGFQKMYLKLVNDARAGHWDDVLSNGLVLKISEDADKYAGAPITDDWQDAVYPLAVHARSVRLQALARQTQATHQLLALFDRHYRDARYAQRTLLFSDLTDVLAKGLPGMGEAGITELCYRLDAKVTHLLLDEFQDTSLQQWAVLEPFAEQITDNFEDSRSLFCVGDTKQAIYGWRGGCAELFDAVEQLPGVEPTTLSKSWRSSQVVLNAVNEVFTSLTGNAALAPCQRAAEDWQNGYEWHGAVQADLPGHVVLQTTAGNTEADPSDAGEDDVAAPPDAHAHDVAGYIRDLTHAHPGRSIGVLMRSRSKAKTLMHALRSLGVFAAEEGGNPIGHTPAVAAVLAAVQFADHPGDRVARFHVMNSPLAEVLGFDADTHPDRLARSIRRSLMDQGYAAVIAGWVQQLAPSCDASSLRRLMQLVELAEAYDEDGATLRPGFFAEAVRSAKVEDASPARVRVMTIHASKGLEFDVVVLPDLDATLSGQDARDLIVLDRDSPIDPVRGVYRRVPSRLAGLTPELEQAHEQRAYEKRTEDLCLLYVAMTRAKQGLHMLIRPLKQGKNGKPTTSGLTNLSYAGVLRQALRGDTEEGFSGGERLYESGDAQWSRGGAETITKPVEPARAPEPIRLARATGQSARSWVKASPSQMHNQARVSASDLLSLGPASGQQYGTLVHAMLERVSFVDEGLPHRAALIQAGKPIHTVGIDHDHTADQLLRALQQPTAQALLRRDGADALWRERRFMVRLNDRLVTGSFDRVHLWHDAGKPARALLIDYKTDRVDEATIDAAVARYADQLRLYREALSVMLGLEVDAIQTGLLFISDDRTVEM